MAEVTKLLFVRHLRSEPSSHVMLFRSGRLRLSGRGQAFWFVPLSASLAEVPCDDRELPFLFHGRSADFQDVTTQGVITFRVSDPETLASRVDFSIDVGKGHYLKAPLDQLSGLLTQLAQQLAWDYLAHTPVREILGEGVDEVRSRIRDGLVGDEDIAGMGLEIVAVRVSAIAPTSDLEKALQTPMREQIQQEADEATFRRRAMAVEKERAIAENELQNRIELSRREEKLIDQEGLNEQRRAREAAEAGRIEAEAEADRNRLNAETKAGAIRVVETARVEAEREKMEIYRDLPSSVMVGLAAQELASKLKRIDHLNVSPDLLGPMLTDLMTAGTRKLEGEARQ